MRLLELFSGTGSVGRVFKGHGWEVISVDLDSKSGATIIGDVSTWDYKVFQPGHFDAIWASPPCTMYSRARTNAKTPRDLEGSDALVRRTLEILEYLKPRRWWMENPATGLLPKREVVASLPAPVVVTYCAYGYQYRKATAIWTNAVEWVPRPRCDPKTCHAMVNGRHVALAQRGSKMATGQPGRTVSELYSIPATLVEELLAASFATA